VLDLNIRDVLQQLSSAATSRSEVRLLLSSVLSRDQAWLVANDTDLLTASQLESVRALVARRNAGEPIAYILLYREFYGRRFACSPAALIPRHETELLIDVAKQSLTSNDALRILDIGTGTGCIAITLALECPSVRVTALDVSHDALALARANARSLDASRIEFIESNWFAALDTNMNDAKFDLIVSNPPYIPPNDPHLTQGDLRFEPQLALQDAIDGLQSYRELVQGAIKHLREGGLLIVEHGYDQGASVPALFREAGFADIEMIRDLADQPRVTSARKNRL
jgi:release factor glutamine methyltransferase